MKPIETIRYLVEAYFHQDWDAEHDSPRDVVVAFCDSETSERRLSLKRELEALLSEDDSEVSASIEGLNIPYDYEANDESRRDWLQWVLSIVDARLGDGSE